MFWYDGSLIDSKQIQLNINEPGLCYGATAFTTMRVYDRSLTHPLTSWNDHSDRLRKTIKAFGWQLPNWQRLQQGAELISTHFPVLRIAIFPDGKEWITGRNLPLDLKQRQTKGITAWVATDLFYRSLAWHKTGNYLTPYLARNRAMTFDAQEAILVDTLNNWLETSTGNLWGWRDGCWYTPSLDSDILPGIARSRLLKYFRDRQILVRENIWTPQFVSTLQALSYSNCVVEIVPIVTVINGESRLEYPIKLP
jgi:4-amino-4-deoxychorismate lyase